MQELVRIRQAQFTPEQEEVFSLVIGAIQQKKPLQLFLDARGGCGKTFLLNAILAAVRTLNPQGCIALATGTTGIAANLLLLGRTFHSRFKAPLTPTENQVFPITGQSVLTKLLQMAKLIIVDEATMLHKVHLENLDLTLRDLLMVNEPFAGKVIILSGDWRQTLPVVKSASRAQIVNICLNRSHLWDKFTIRTLSVNMRVQATGDTDLEAFDKWCLNLGNGNIPICKSEDVIKLPEDLCIRIGEKTTDQSVTMSGFCEMIYPNIEINSGNSNWLEGRAILAPTNRMVDRINQEVIKKMPGEPIVLLSSDDLDNPEDAFRFNTEYLNTLSPMGLPEHRLYLKTGIVLMLLRNLNPSQGLCNGTRLILQRVENRVVLHCTICGDINRRIVKIPRVTLRPREGEFAFEWSRRQFPVRPAFSFTINKAQGQTLRQVGVWLMDPVFTHGQVLLILFKNYFIMVIQAYVAASRVGSHTSIKFALPYKQREEPTTRNVVFKEVLEGTLNQLQPNSQHVASEQTCEVNFPDHDHFPGDLDDRETVDDIDCSNDLENESPVMKSKYKAPNPTHKRSCSPAKNVDPEPETTPRLPVVSAKPQCDYEMIRLKNIQEREELWNSLNQIELDIIHAGGEVDWAHLLKRYQKNKNRELEFKKEVIKFISTQKQGSVGTNVFKLEDLKTYIFSKNSSFSQVILLCNYI